MPDLFSLPTRFSRWLSVSEGNGEKQMSLAHPLIGRSFEVVLGQNESENALRDLVSWASDAWKPRTPANPLFGSERSGALYPLRWLVEHLLEFPRTGPSAARSLLLDPEWLERKIASGLEFEVLRDFSIVIASLDPDGPVILLRLVADAFRNNLHHIIDSFTDYPQILTQAILNYLRPLHPSTLGTESSDLPPSVTPSILDLTTSWEARARTRGWSWINLTWIDRKRAFLGEQQWQAKMGARPADHLAFSPSGASVAAASKWLYTNRENPPSEWPMAYDIAVWSARDGKLLDRPRPDANSVRLDDLPEDIPRPDAADKVFRAYFAHRKKQQETSPVAPLAFDFSSWVEAPKPVEEDDPITWEVGHHWTETLIAGDVDALVWLDEKTLLASGRGGRIFGFDTVARTQSLMVQQSNVDAELVVRDWRETKIGSLERISATAFAAGTGFGTVEIRDLQSPDQTKEYRVEPIEDRSVSRTAVRALSYDAASGYLAIGLTDASVRVIEVGSGREVRRFLGHGQDIIGLAWAPSGDRLASISYDRTLRVWSLETGGEVITPVEHPMDTLSLAWGIDDEQILTTWNENGKGGTIRIWKATSGELVSEFGAGTALIEAMAVSRETGLVAAGGKDGYVRVFDPKSHGITRMPARSHRTSIRDASLAVSRMELATLSLDGILVWSCTTGEVVNSYKAEWERYLAWTTCVLYSPAEDRLAAVLGNSVYMFEANTLSLLWCHSAGPRDIRFCRFSGDGKYFLTDDDKDPPEGNGSVLWEAETGEPIARSKQHGFEAEMVLYDYDNLISEEVNSSPSGSTSLTKWKSVMRNIENTGLTRIHLTDADGRSHEFILEAAIQRSFRLPAIGRWVFIIRGGRAPVMASVVWA
jgi:WD40 repeat protein